MNIENKNKHINDGWLKDKNHSILKELYIRDGAIYQLKSGEIVYRLSPNENWTITKNFKAVSNVLSNFLERKIDLSSFSKYISKHKKISLSINPEDLIIVTGEIFNPHCSKEFIKGGKGIYLRNSYKPSYFMQLNFNINLFDFQLNDSYIIKLIHHLTNYNVERTHWILNWLAYFFQELKKSQVALLLIGPQGAGKGILFNNIIKPLIGESYAKTINDKSLNSNYLGGLLENVLFFNFDEISVNKSINSSIKNFLKAIVTNDSITAEKKNITMNEEIKLYGQVLITTNEDIPIEIEDGDRRYTVFKTAYNLKNYDYLGLGSYEALAKVIENELESFIFYLKKYHVDVKLANTALFTNEKNYIINEYKKIQLNRHNRNSIKIPKLSKLEKNVKDFIFNIQNKNKLYFANLACENCSLYLQIINDIDLGYFRLDNLLPAFKNLYGSNIRTTSELLMELQKDLSSLFSIQNLYTYNIQNENVNVFRIMPTQILY